MSDELNIKKKKNNQIKTKSSTTSGRGEADIDYVRLQNYQHKIFTMVIVL